MARKLIGIEVGGGSLTAVKLRPRWRRHVIESVFSVDLPTDPDDVENWENARMAFHEWAGSWLHASTIVSSLPGDEAIPVPIAFPFRKVSKIAQVLKAEIEGYVPLNVEDSIVDFVPLIGPSEKGLEVIAIAASKSGIGGHLARLALLDIDPDIVTYSPIAGLKAILEMSQFEKNRGLGVLHLGSGYASFSICNEGRPTFIRTFRLDRTPRPLERVEEPNLSVNRDSLFRDLQFTLRAYAQSLEKENALENIVISGGGEDLQALASLIESNFGLPCRVASWGKGLSTKTKNTLSASNLSELVPALGAALLPTKPFGKGFDLRRDEFARSKGWRALQVPIAVAAVAAIIALGIGVADLTLKVRQAERQLSAMEANLQGVLSEVVPAGQRIGRPGPQISGRVRAKARRLDFLTGNPSMGESALSLIKRISAAIPASLKLRLTQLSVDEGGISLKGVTLTFESVDRVKNLLSQKAGFEKPEVKQARLLSNKRGVEFFLHIPINGKRNS